MLTNIVHSIKSIGAPRSLPTSWLNITQSRLNGQLLISEENLPKSQIYTKELVTEKLRKLRTHVVKLKNGEAVVVYDKQTRPTLAS